MSQEASFFDVLAADEGRRNNRLVWLVLGMFVLLGVAGYFAAVRYADGRVPFGTRVGAMPIGGMDRAEAVAALGDRFDDVPDRRISLVYEDQSFPLLPREAGFAFDSTATVAVADVRNDRRSPADLWEFFTGGRAITPHVDVNEQAFASAVHGLAQAIGRPVREATWDFTADGLRAVPGRSGVDVDPDGARALIREVMFRQSATHAELPVTVREPHLDSAALARARRTIGVPALSGPVTFTLVGVTVVARPADFAPSLSMIPDDRDLVLRVDGERLMRALAPRMRGIADEPRSARLVTRHGRPHVLPSAIGVSYDVTDFEQRFAAAAVARGKARTFTLPAVVQQPRRTTAQVRALGVTTRIGTFTIPLAASRAAVAALDGTVVGSGGRATVPAPLAGPAFNAAFLAGLPVTRAYVTLRDTRYPWGRETAPDTAIMFANDSRYPVLVAARRVDGRVTIDLWSTADRHVVLPPAVCGAGGDVVVRRVVRRAGQAPTTDTFTARYLNSSCPVVPPPAA